MYIYDAFCAENRAISKVSHSVLYPASVAVKVRPNRVLKPQAGEMREGSEGQRHCVETEILRHMFGLQPEPSNCNAKSKTALRLMRIKLFTMIPVAIIIPSMSACTLDYVYIYKCSVFSPFSW